MSPRRLSNPQSTQHLWDAIKIIRYQRQTPTFDRIARFMVRVYEVKAEEVAEQLDLCVQDGLITLTNKVGARGSKIGVEQKGYFLPKGPVIRDDHDWYCFSCHLSGEVICCTSCWRVYHRDCLASDEVAEEDMEQQVFVCGVCKECNSDIKDEALLKIKKKDLNRLLSYTCQLLAGFCPVSLLSREVPSSGSYAAYLLNTGADEGAEPAETARGWVTDQDDEWRGDHLVYNPVDLVAIRGKADGAAYERPEEMKADVQTLLHNMVVYHGEDHEITASARKMLDDCVYDLGEIRRCPDCYRVSNEQAERDWFCRPCRPPHELVYAKQGSYPYWPAKVMRVEGDAYDVRFFGGPHQRAIIARNYIRPITAGLATLQIKRTAAWIKADEELKVHLDKLKEVKKENPENIYDFNSSDDEAPTASVEKPKLKKSLPERLKSSTERPKKTIKKARRETGGSLPAALDDTGPAVKPTVVVKAEEDMVSSSCQYTRGVKSKAIQTAPVKAAPTKAALDKLRRENEQATKKAVESACRELRQELEETHAEEIRGLKEEHATELSEVKLKQWCYNCEREAIYHCCWNTAYCSTKCQQDHWITQHKPHCRRKRV